MLNIGFGEIKSRQNLAGFRPCDPARARTEDPKIKSLLLYQLSYGVKNLSCKYTVILFCRKFLAPIFAVLKREHSSAGSEHLPYKQRVRGSNPCAPTKIKKGFQAFEALFYYTRLIYNLIYK